MDRNIDPKTIFMFKIDKIVSIKISSNYFGNFF